MSTAAADTRWNVDHTHTVVEFAVRHMMISTVKGVFKKFHGTIYGDPSDPASLRLEGEVDAASVDTGVEDRDNHLRSPDFFDVENHPTITYRSRQVRPLGDGEVEIIGDLTIRGITREVPLKARIEGPGKDPWGNQRIAIEATARINREDFDLKWNAVLETGGVLVSKDVTINLHAEAVQQA